jgi:phosphoglucosamine mutase
MGRKYFGTDGIRGRVGDAPIVPQFVMRLGYAAGRVLTQGGGGRPTVLIGKDTRISGYMLEAALEAGFAAAGVDVLLSGPIPTPAVAYLTRALRLSAGVVISASHNPFDDNGIKFFSGTATSCRMPSKSASSPSSKNPWAACAPNNSVVRAAWKMRRAATSSSARVPFHLRSTCVG